MDEYPEGSHRKARERAAASGDHSRRSFFGPVFRTAVVFGGLIGLVLLAIQYGRFLFPLGRPADGFATLVGVIFLGAGVSLGARLARDRNPPPPAKEPFEPPVDSPLSPREAEILLSLAEGLSNDEIAERHFVSVNTVKTHLRQIFAKLEVRRRAQAIARARELGLLP